VNEQRELLTISAMNLAANLENVRINEKILTEDTGAVIIELLKQILEVLRDDKDRRKQGGVHSRD
jgi:hypothetical protein